MVISGILKDKVTLIYADTDMTLDTDITQWRYHRHEFYNLAAAVVLLQQAGYTVGTADIDAIGVTNMLEAIKIVKP